MGLHCSKKVTCVIKRINIRTLQQFLLFELLSLFPNKKLKSHKKVCAKKDFCNILMSSETIKKTQLYGPILWMGSTASRLEPLGGCSLFFTTEFAEIPGTPFINLERMNG